MLMEYFWHIISSGLLIGIFISAPMGPIGMLVIQRTLNKGRRPALFTGVGAALSDLTYSLLTGLGLSFITDFIIAKELLLQIIGSVVLIAFALYLFKKNPTLALKKPDNAPNTFWKDFGTGFLFTFANPLILFFIIGLFARFNFLLPEFRYYHYRAAPYAVQWKSISSAKAVILHTSTCWRIRTRANTGKVINFSKSCPLWKYSSSHSYSHSAPYCWP